LDGDGTQETTRLHVIDLRHQSQSSVVALTNRLGAMMPVESRHRLALYDHPRLIEIETGLEVASWHHR
jgi:hypothetical protein